MSPIGFIRNDQEFTPNEKCCEHFDCSGGELCCCSSNGFDFQQMLQQTMMGNFVSRDNEIEPPKRKAGF